jgi:hypothetical protein
MSYGLVGLYALFFIFIGSNGNATKLKDAVSNDAKGFAPWLIAIIILRWMYSSDTLKPIVKPFIFLAVLVFVLKNYGKLVTQLNSVTGLNLPTGNTGGATGSW